MVSFKRVTVNIHKILEYSTTLYYTLLGLTSLYYILPPLLLFAKILYGLSIIKSKWSKMNRIWFKTNWSKSFQQMMIVMCVVCLVVASGRPHACHHTRPKANLQAHPWVCPLPCPQARHQSCPLFVLKLVLRIILKMEINKHLVLENYGMIVRLQCH